jgi:serine/threonine protein kinase
LQPELSEPRFPVIGDSIEEFRLLSELGRGSRGRVFLAAQAALADRLVVLKLTPWLSGEHVSLARLQHTNIVPLFSVHEDESRCLRILCMPYLGNANLAALLEGVSAIPVDRRAGRDLVAAMDRIQERVPAPPLPAAANRHFLARLSYEEAICWIGACCADALQYAHERRLVHLDLKPSNILLAADGQPMLLDFHLARQPLEAGHPADELGGTPAYMAPEQGTAIEAAGEGEPVPTVVDGRADIFALGAVLYEALAGRSPNDVSLPSFAAGPGSGGQRLSLRRLNRSISVGLSDIVAKCLAADPVKRYADAASLAADLRRHIRNQPLLGVANRSMAERWRKWRRRRPAAFQRLLLWCIFVGAVLTSAAVFSAYTIQQIGEARSALRYGQTECLERDYAKAVETLQRGLARLETIPWTDDLSQQLTSQLSVAKDGLVTAKREREGRELHRLVAELRVLPGIDHILVSRLRELAHKAGNLWEKRSQIREQIGHGADDDLADVAFSIAELTVRSATAAEMKTARHRALQVVDEAEEMVGARALLEYERQVQSRMLGGEAATVARRPLPEPRTPSERLAFGRALLSDGRDSKQCPT